MQDETELIELQ